MREGSEFVGLWVRISETFAHSAPLQEGAFLSPSTPACFPLPPRQGVWEGKVKGQGSGSDGSRLGRSQHGWTSAWFWGWTGGGQDTVYWCFKAGMELLLCPAPQSNLAFGSSEHFRLEQPVPCPQARQSG